MQVIGDDIWEKTFLDVGSGGDDRLGLDLSKKSVIYTAFDKDPRFLEKLRGSNLSTKIGNILFPQPDLGSYDIVHTRCLLMHIPEEHRPKVIRNILNLAIERAIFLELDWSTFEAGGNVTEEFQKFSLELISEFSDPLIGKRLLQEVAKVAEGKGNVREIKDDVFRREAGAYYYEIIPLVKMMIRMMEQKEHRLLGRGKEVLRMITEESKKQDHCPEMFIPPSVVYVEAIF